MAIHFTDTELALRLANAQQAMQARGLDALFCFEQESMFWLTGYDTFGFCFFQCLIVTADGRMALLTRSADQRQAELTSIVSDIRIWKDAANAKPSYDLRDLAEAMGLQNKRIGFEAASYGLTHQNGKALEAAFSGFAPLVDASGLITRLRAIKSDAELVYVRQAAALSDAADQAALAAIRAGADEGEVLAAQHNAIFAGGGDYPGNEFIIGSGPEALLCRYKSGRRKLGRNDQITLEFAGAFRHYHAAMMRTVIVGAPKPLHAPYHAAAQKALTACEDEMRPGQTAGEVFAAHQLVFNELGLSQHRLNACGYSLGAKFTPSWMDWPMFYAGNDWVLEAGMVMFAHMILMDSASGTAMCLGRTCHITRTGAEPLNAPDTGLMLR